MPNFEVPDISFITKLPELFTTSTQSCRKGWFSQPSRDLYVPSRGRNATTAKGAQQFSQNTLTRRASTRIQAFQRQVMNYRQQLTGFKPAPNTPLWNMQKTASSVYQSVQNQIYAIPGYWERAISPVKSWLQSVRLPEKPIIPEAPPPIAFNAPPTRAVSGAGSGLSQMNEKALPLQIDRKPTNGFSIERKAAPPLGPSSSNGKGQSIEDLTASVDEALGKWGAPKMPEKTTGWNGKRKPVQESTGPLAPEPLKTSSGHATSGADEDPWFDFLMRDIQTRPVSRKPVEPSPHLTDPEAYESRTLIDDLLADLRSGKSSPRNGRAANRQQSSSMNPNISDSAVVKTDTPPDKPEHSG